MLGYYDSAEDLEITRSRALLELKRHGFEDQETIGQFDADCGKHETYQAQDVLSWLGY